MVEPTIGGSEPEALRRTPLHDEHLRLGARLIPFAGFAMPVQYGRGIVDEHTAVRQRAGLFDVSHMGELEIRGEDPLGLIQYATTNDASTLEVGQAQYTVLCQEDGGALDDCIVFRFPAHLLIVTNASNRERDRDWLRKFAGRFGCEVLDRSDDVGLLALQGPSSQAILARVTRSAMLNVVQQDYILTARAKGLSEQVLMYRHALKNALIPVVTVTGLQLAYMLSGVIIVEIVFSWPGLGLLAFDAVDRRDYSVLQGVVLLMAAIFLVINLIVDLLYAWLDPRIKYD
jgi:hypothetical protein